MIWYCVGRTEDREFGVPHPVPQTYLVRKAAYAVLIVAVIRFRAKLDDVQLSNSRPVDGSEFHFAELLQRRQRENFELLLGTNEDLDADGGDMGGGEIKYQERFVVEKAPRNCVRHTYLVVAGHVSGFCTIVFDHEWRG